MSASKYDRAAIATMALILLLATGAVVGAVWVVATDVFSGESRESSMEVSPLPTSTTTTMLPDFNPPPCNDDPFGCEERWAPLPPCNDDDGCPGDINVLPATSVGPRLYAKSPLHECAATMADIRPGVVVEVYNLEYGLLYAGEITSWPYPVPFGSGDVHYAVAVDVEEQSWPDHGFLGDMGLVPYVPGGRWNPANFTVVQGTCKGGPLPAGR